MSTSLTICTADFHHQDNTQVAFISNKHTRFLNVPNLLKLFLRYYDIFSHGDTHLKLVGILTSRSRRFSFSETARVSLDVIIEKVDKNRWVNVLVFGRIFYANGIPDLNELESLYHQNHQNEIFI